MAFAEPGPGAHRAGEAGPRLQRQPRGPGWLASTSRWWDPPREEVVCAARSSRAGLIPMRGQKARNLWGDWPKSLPRGCPASRRQPRSAAAGGHGEVACAVTASASPSPHSAPWGRVLPAPVLQVRTPRQLVVRLRSRTLGQQPSGHSRPLLPGGEGSRRRWALTPQALGRTVAPPSSLT